MSIPTSNYGLIKPELTDAADITAYNNNWDTIDNELNKLNEDFSSVDDRVNDLVDEVNTLGERIVSATSTDGVSYNATIGYIGNLYNGLELTIVPTMTSTTNALTLNLNGLGAKSIKLPLSTNTSAAVTPDTANFLVANRPVTLMYDANYSTSGAWLAVNKQKTSASDLYGTVPIENGGTGATSGDAALMAMFGAGLTVLSSYQYGDALPSAGVKGRIFFKKVTG